MILDVFPSYKDKEIVDKLYQYERSTRLSLNILVEKYLESILLKNGYLEESMGEIPAPKIEELNHQDPHFRKGNVRRGYVEVWYEDLCFGNVKIENYDERVENLKQFSFDELKEISKNNWDKSHGQYNFFLKWKIKNPSKSLNDYLHDSQFKIRFSRTKGAYRIHHKGFSMCSVKEEETMEKIKKYLFDLSDEELSILKKELENTSENRRKYILRKMEDK